MSATYSQDTLRLTVTTPLGKDKLLVRAFDGEERISGLFRFTLEMASQGKSLDFSASVGKPLTVTLLMNDGTKHHFNGIVGRLMQTEGNVRLTTYYAEIH